MQKELEKVEGVDYVVCPLCGAQLRQLHQHILHTHNMDVDRFREQYPLCPLSCDDSHILNSRKTGSASLLQARLYDWLRLTLNQNIVCEYRLGPTFLDVAFPDKQMALELDGDFFHGTGGTAIQKRVSRYAKFKENAITAAGWSVLHISEEALSVETVKTVKEILVWLREDPTKVPDTLNLYPDRRQTCLRCGKQLSLKQICSKKQFCSDGCMTMHKKEHPEVHVACFNCGILPTPIVDKRRRFCSTECRDEYLRKNAKSITQCKNCGKTLYCVTQEPTAFCNKTCMRQYMALHHAEYVEWRGMMSRNSEYNRRRREEGRVRFVCPNCGKAGWKHARALRNSKSGKLFCCHKCYTEFKKKNGGQTCN